MSDFQDVGNKNSFQHFYTCLEVTINDTISNYEVVMYNWNNFIPIGDLFWYDKSAHSLSY